MATISARHFVWDIPTRIFHWAIVLLLGFSWWSAETHHMDWHYRSGLTVCFLLVIRILWGFIGTSSSRFANFVKGPATVLAYLRPGVPNARLARLGHNPLGGWSVLVLLGLLVFQVTTGLFAVDVDGMESGPLSYLVDFDMGRTIAKLHHLSFSLLQVMVVLHVVAILFYLIVKRNNLTGAMISGFQRTDPAIMPDPVRRVTRWRIALVVIIAALVTYAIANGFRF